MPKRTNDFQELITKIYKQLAAPDETITPSAIVRERENGTEREIDILLKKKVFGTTISIAVECRGRSDKDDIQWIDELIGKYRDLPINKVVAVSKSGFTQAAEEKARANRIDPLTLIAALETNWPNEFVKLGFAQITRDDRPYKIEVITDGIPASSLSLNPSSQLITEDDELIGSLNDAGKFIYEQNKEKITKEIEKLFFKAFKTLGDFKEHKAIVGIPVTPSIATFIYDNGKKVKVKQITLEMLCSFSYEIRNVSHHILGERQISQARFTNELGKDEFTITAIQETTKPNQVNVRFEKNAIPLPKAKKVTIRKKN